MGDREDSDLHSTEHISDEVGERVRAVLAAAESAATAIRHEAEQQGQVRKRAAEQERQHILENAKAEADALIDERVKRLSELSDSLIEGAEALLLRIDAAHEVREQFENVLGALAAAAADLAREREVAHKPPSISVVADEPPEAPGGVVTELRAAQQPEPETPPATETEPEEEAAEPEPEEPRRISPVERLREAAGNLRGAENGGDEAPAEPQQQASPIEGDEVLAARLVALQMAVAGSARGEVEAHLRKTFDLGDPAAILNDVFGTESKL